MEDQAVIDLVQAGDRFAFFIAAGVSAGNQHHRGGRAGVNFQDRVTECASGYRFQQLHQIRLNARKYRSEEHTSELQSLMRISYAVFCLKKKTMITKAKLRMII